VAKLVGGRQALGALGESWPHAAIASVITVARRRPPGRPAAIHGLLLERMDDTRATPMPGWMRICGRNVDRARQVGVIPTERALQCLTLTAAASNVGDSEVLGKSRRQIQKPESS